MHCLPLLFCADVMYGRKEANIVLGIFFCLQNLQLPVSRDIVQASYMEAHCRNSTTHLFVDYSNPEIGWVSPHGRAEEGHLDRRQQEYEHEVAGEEDI